ncbi:maleylpyruvate isomerase family mycothiol-dependent enzyme [Geodermatophilus sp. DSM 45219]|uniref:maleylpyruvate isomerase family mycothiol-dependent enzyme n=1 Tax=Geodermatophilus sp. DSM 45219 TaxID=1881103 RepID=UPI000882AC1E|nr:maleylpyruvate isomerase family mycothiol-dependent enzyme [Geodermatophilus sp. DSM 45219]SDO17529.1 TIGR03083 family protein [Geodermatophilus sp. DSM 45219]
MDLDAVWRTIDAERAGLADLLDELSPAEWAAPSLCDAWRVGDVAAHLTLAHMGPGAALVGAVRARGSFDRMIRDTALRAASLPRAEYPRRLRAMVGSRRTAPFVTPTEPLIDVLVHGQDIAVPLGRDRPVPVAAAVAAATRVWGTGFPFRARRRLQGFRLSATDADWTVGSGLPVEGPIAALLLLVTGREAALDRLSGAGAHRLQAARGRRDGAPGRPT